MLFDSKGSDSYPRPIDQGFRLRYHLLKVYGTLCATTVAGALGSWTHVLYNIGGWLTWLLSVFLVILIGVTKKEKRAERTLYLGMFGFAMGTVIGPLVKFAVDLDPWILVHAFVVSVVVFGCFTAMAFLMDENVHIQIAGTLASGLTWLAICGFANIFFGSELLFNIQLYGGLALFCGFVVYDTQLITEKFKEGDEDYLAHAMRLFMDFLEIFVRIVIILAKQKKKNKKSE